MGEMSGCAYPLSPAGQDLAVGHKTGQPPNGALVNGTHVEQTSGPIPLISDPYPELDRLRRCKRARTRTSPSTTGWC